MNPLPRLPISRACLVAGLAVLALIWLGPLVSTWRDSFAAHMLAHMGVVAIAAPLLALGFSRITARQGCEVRSQAADIGTPSGPSGHLPRRRGGGSQAWCHSLPSTGRVPSEARRVGWLAASNTLRRKQGGDSPPLALFLPILASLVELVVVWAWHAPVLRDLAERSNLVTAAEQLMFLAAGLFLWMSCLAAARAGDAAHAAAGAFGLLLTTVHMTLLGALLALSPRPLFGAGEVTCFGLVLSSAQDQQLGGVVMLFVGAAVYLAGGVYLLSRVLDGNLSRRQAAG